MLEAEGLPPVSGKDGTDGETAPGDTATGDTAPGDIAPPVPEEGAEGSPGLVTPVSGADEDPPAAVPSGWEPPLGGS